MNKQNGNWSKTREKTGNWGKLLCIILLCAIVRLFFLLSWNENYKVLPVDVDGYWEIAGNLVTGNGFAQGRERFLTARRAPGCPLFLAGVRWLTQGKEPIALASQAIIDAVTCTVIYTLAIAVTDSLTIAYVACLFWAIYLPEASMITRFWSEPLGALFLTSALFLYILAGKQNKFWLYGISGLVFGATTLTRPEYVLLPVLLATVLFIGQGKGFAQHAVRTGVFLIGFSLCLAPWSIRNTLVFRRFVPLTTHLGPTLFVGNATLDEDAYLTHRGTSYALRKFPNLVGNTALSHINPFIAPTDSEIELNRLYQQEAWRLIREHPVRFGVLSVIRFPRLWFNLGFGRAPSWMSWGIGGVNFMLILLCIIGLITGGKTWPGQITPLLLTLLYGTLVHLPIDGLTRYIFPLIPALTILSAAGFMVMWTKLRAFLGLVSK